MYIDSLVWDSTSFNDALFIEISQIHIDFAIQAFK